MPAPIPQQARAVATRDGVLVACIALLAEVGLAGASTAAVARRAEVSQGALFRHFPTKADLLAAATDRALSDLFDDFLAALPTALSTGDALEAGLRVLWEVYLDPRLAGVFELFLAARTDPALQTRLAPLILAHANRERQIARMLFPEAAHRDDFDEVVTGLLSTLQGAAVAAGTLPGEAGRLELRFIIELVRRELGSPALPDALTAGVPQ
jgi:AcrR family transcriptional regulator